MSDTPDRKEMEELFRLQDAALQAAANAIVITSADGTIRWVNRAFAALTGYCAEEAIGKTPGQLIRSCEQGREFYSNLWNTILAGDVWHGELVNRRKDGSLYCEEQSISPVRDAQGTITHFIGIKQDITERRHMASRLAYQANYDALTQLPNRYLCVDRLQHALTSATRHGRSVGVLSLDIDRFRTLNDALGHDAGDEALRAVAQRLQSTVRGEDTVARISADEFAVILADLAQPLDAALVAKKVADAFKVPFRVQPSDAGGEGLEFMFSVSVGVSLHPNDGADSETLLNRAQTAMHRAKEHGPGHHQFFTGDMDRAERQRLDLHNALRHALEQDEFALHYQPQTDATGERIVGVEALLRWNRPGHGQVPPADFLPMLEETGLIVAVGEWVLHQACAQFMALREAGVPVPRMAINVSAPAAPA